MTDSTPTPAEVVDDMVDLVVGMIQAIGLQVEPWQRRLLAHDLGGHLATAAYADLKASTLVLDETTSTVTWQRDVPTDWPDLNPYREERAAQPSVPAAVEAHGYERWLAGQAHCACGRRFMSVQDLDAHVRAVLAQDQQAPTPTRIVTAEEVDEMVRVREREPSPYHPANRGRVQDLDDEVSP